MSYKKRALYFILLFTFIGFLLAITQTLGESRDYSQYDYFLKLLRDEGLDLLNTSRFEPGFTLLSFALVALASSNLFVYSSIAAASMFLKGFAIYFFSLRWPVFCIVAIFYFARYFPLYELTQLRVACAVAFLLVAWMCLWKANRVFGLLACMAAVLFHMSAAFVIPTLFIQPTRRRIVILLGAGVFLAITLAVGAIIGALGDTLILIEMHQNAGFGEAPNPFSAALLLDWAMIVVGLLMWPRFSPLMKHVLFLEIIGMAIFYGTIDFAVIAHRIRELFSIFWIIFVAQGLRLEMSVKLISACFVIASVCLYSYLFIFSGREFFS